MELGTVLFMLTIGEDPPSGRNGKRGIPQELSTQRVGFVYFS